MPDQSAELAEIPSSVSNTADEVEQLFAAGGALARRLPGYRVRAQQLDMARAVARTLDEGGTLVAEAGTGTGKTYAYLAPALLKGGKVLVSTGTKTLQDQLFARDLPQLVAAMQVPASIALLKGRGNYLCHLHLQRTQDDDRALKSRHEVAQLRHIVKFAKRTRTGDRAELAEVPDNAEIWSKVTSTRENCLGADCEFYRDCFVVKARKAAQDAEVVVVNHSLFLADMALKDEGISELLPTADCVIFDEAHQLPDVATRFLGESVSTHQMMDFARDVMSVGLAHSRDSADWQLLTRSIEQAARDLRLACAQVERMPGQKSAFDTLPDQDGFEGAISAACSAVRTVGQVVAAVRERHPDLELLARRAPELFARLQRWLPQMAPHAEPAGADTQLESAWPEPGDTASQTSIAGMEPSSAGALAALATSGLDMAHDTQEPADGAPASADKQPDDERNATNQWIRWI